jgi:hypothetical protein
MELPRVVCKKKLAAGLESNDTQPAEAKASQGKPKKY